MEGTLAKPFRSNLQPVEIGRRLTREMDLHRRVGVRGLIAPNAFAVTLSPADVNRFASFVDALSRELADAAREHARIESLLLRRPGRGRDLRRVEPQGRPVHGGRRGARERGRGFPGRDRALRRAPDVRRLGAPGHRAPARVQRRPARTPTSAGVTPRSAARGTASSSPTSGRPTEPGSTDRRYGSSSSPVATRSA